MCIKIFSFIIGYYGFFYLDLQNESKYLSCIYLEKQKGYCYGLT